MSPGSSANRCPIDPAQIESLYDRYQNVYGR